MKVEMLSTGDEVLHGQIVDTNAAWLAAKFYEAGFALTFRTTSGDDLATLVETLQQRSQVADVLIVNGGLGPTSDDFSAQAAAQAAGVDLVRNGEWVQEMEDFFARRGRKLTAINLKQADLPAGAEMLPNGNGTACGFRIVLNNCQVFFTPGPPVEFQMMVTEQILPRLAKLFPQPEPHLCLRLTTFGRGESDIAQQLSEIHCPEGIVIGYRAASPIVEVKLSGLEHNRTEMSQIWQQIKDILRVNILFEGEEGFASEVAQLLKQQGYLLSVDEGFTAGYLYWTLASAQTPLSGGTIGAFAADKRLIAENDLHSLIPRGLALTVSELTEQQQLEFSLVTPHTAYYFKVSYTQSHYQLQTRQEVITLQAIYLLHRWLTSQPVEIIHQSLQLLASEQFVLSD